MTGQSIYPVQKIDIKLYLYYNSSIDLIKSYSFLTNTDKKTKFRKCDIQISHPSQVKQ